MEGRMELMGEWTDMYIKKQIRMIMKQLIIINLDFDLEFIRKTIAKRLLHFDIVQCHYQVNEN